MNFPLPTTPPRSSPFPALPNKRRKVNSDAGAYVDPAALLAFLEKQSLNENSSSEDIFKSFQHIQAMAKEAMQLTRAVIRTKIPTSSLEMSDIQHRLGVVYKDSSSDSQWDIAQNADQDRRNGTPWLESALDDIANDEGWSLESCEALVRTVIDLILFDRLKLLDRGSPIKMFPIIGEYQINTKTVDPNVVISGRCDYALGYGGVPGKKDLDQALVAIEVKKRYHLLPNSPQLIGYLVGIQQRRQKAEKVVSIVYGIATDGVNFCFHRLDHARCLRTKFVVGVDKQLIHRYIDIILESALRDAPHTSPAGRFPGTSAAFETTVERPLWDNPVVEGRSMIVETESQMDYVIRPDADGDAHLVYVGEEQGDDADHDGLVVVDGYNM
ncbi:hypothetical protein Q9L58_007826 [Maublancomyces gigas]|uniref:Uncharacterized protein n=1 Tax=Discina gigas TaxID=1032678 RepID=A0ABR3GBM9_9PEZI